MATVEQVRRGLSAYADKEIIGRLPPGTFRRVAVGAAVALALQRGIDTAIHNPAAAAIGLVGADNAVDVDALRDVIKAQLDGDGVTVDVLGVKLTFRAPDVDTIYSYIIAD